MAEKKNTEFERPGGYATPKGAIHVQAKAAKSLLEADIRLLGDTVPPHATPSTGVEPAYRADDPDTRLYVGDCRTTNGVTACRGRSSNGSPSTGSMRAWTASPRTARSG
jgi:hypothetical protein